jgi:hypothetical protein
MLLLFLVKSSKRRRAPSTENGTVPPRLIAYSARRPREYLTVKEVGLLIDTARDRGRYGHRDATMIPPWTPGGELCALRWDQVDLEHGLLHVQRAKNGTPSVHPKSIAVIRFDFRGHNDSGGPIEKVTISTASEDLLSVVHWLENTHPHLASLPRAGCKQLGCDTLVFGDGNALRVHNVDKIKASGIRIVVIPYARHHPTYPQLHSARGDLPFMPGLSVIDALL